MKKRLVQLIRPWVAELVIRGFIPERIRQYRILDCLSAWESGDGIQPL
jgi:hypothetical protein